MESTDIKTPESGNIYLFYRPRVEEDEPEGIEDLQRFYFVLSHTHLQAVSGGGK